MTQVVFVPRVEISAPPPPGEFVPDDFNRSDGSLQGDEGWTTYGGSLDIQGQKVFYTTPLAVQSVGWLRHYQGDDWAAAGRTDITVGDDGWYDISIQAMVPADYQTMWGYGYGQLFVRTSDVITENNGYSNTVGFTLFFDVFGRIALQEYFYYDPALGYGANSIGYENDDINYDVPYDRTFAENPGVMQHLRFRHNPGTGASVAYYNGKEVISYTFADGTQYGEIKDRSRLGNVTGFSLTSTFDGPTASFIFDNFNRPFDPGPDPGLTGVQNLTASIIPNANGSSFGRVEWLWDAPAQGGAPTHFLSRLYRTTGGDNTLLQEIDGPAADFTLPDGSFLDSDATETTGHSFRVEVTPSAGAWSGPTMTATVVDVPTTVTKTITPLVFNGAFATITATYTFSSAFDEAVDGVVNPDDSGMAIIHVKRGTTVTFVLDYIERDLSGSRASGSPWYTGFQHTWGSARTTSASDGFDSGGFYGQSAAGWEVGSVVTVQPQTTATEVRLQAVYHWIYDGGYYEDRYKAIRILVGD